MIYSFKNDYSSIAHPLVLKKLLECSNEQNVGYGLDEHTVNAKKLILEKTKSNSDVYFLVGGTQTNLVVISSALRPHEAVICVKSGHINLHETGAIEGQGHKCVLVDGENGKVRPCDIEDVLKEHVDFHMVKPKLVYISNSTELGTVYSREEIISLYECCKNNNLFLFLDGARLATALAATNLTYEDLAKYTDVFYIGGTKAGGYIGEAVVINNDLIKYDFAYSIKHYGAMLAKGYVGAIPFEVLMKDDLYYSIGKQENECAQYLSKELEKLGVEFLVETCTNQLFPIITKKQAELMYDDYPFEIWEDRGEKVVIRLVTSFTTNIEHCQTFINYFSKLQIKTKE